VLVITAGALKETIKVKKSLKMEMFHTVVFDEVHNATGAHDFCTIVNLVRLSAEEENIICTANLLLELLTKEEH